MIVHSLGFGSIVPSPLWDVFVALEWCLAGDGGDPASKMGPLEET